MKKIIILGACILLLTYTVLAGILISDIDYIVDKLHKKYNTLSIDQIKGDIKLLPEETNNFIIVNKNLEQISFNYKEKKYTLIKNVAK